MYHILSRRLPQRRQYLYSFGVISRSALNLQQLTDRFQEVQQIGSFALLEHKNCKNHRTITACA
jgi:hypothetical protein